jgi:F-type H+-transporting ATPase subunit delta
MKLVNTKKLAEALVRVGREQSVFDSLVQDLESTSEKINENLELKRYLTDQHVLLRDKRTALATVFQDFISARTYNFLMLLIKSKKLEYLDEILSVSRKLYLQVDDVQEVVIESVVVLSPEVEKNLNDILMKKLNRPLVLRNMINPDLIGGLRIFIGDRVIDSSLRGKLDRLQETINKIE